MKGEVRIDATVIRLECQWLESRQSDREPVLQMQGFLDGGRSKVVKEEGCDWRHRMGPSGEGRERIAWLHGWTEIQGMSGRMVAEAALRPPGTEAHLPWWRVWAMTSVEGKRQFWILVKECALTCLGTITNARKAGHFSGYVRF